MLLRDGDWLTADGTTLGADDGVAIAAMMALVDDASLPHGPLELLMTVAEEVGLEGANGLDGSLVTGSTCEPRQRGGRRPHGRVRREHRHLDPGRRARAPRAPPDAIALVGVARGGLGGHSGVQIALGRSNAIKVLGRALREASGDRAVPARLARRRQEPQRDPARRGRGLLASRAIRRGVPGRRRVGDRGRSRTPTRRPIPGVTMTVESAADAATTPGRRRRRRRCSTSSRSCRPGRSR